MFTSHNDQTTEAFSEVTEAMSTVGASGGALGKRESVNAIANERNVPEIVSSHVSGLSGIVPGWENIHKRASLRAGTVTPQTLPRKCAIPRQVRELSLTLTANLRRTDSFGGRVCLA